MENAQSTPNQNVANWMYRQKCLEAIADKAGVRSQGDIFGELDEVAKAIDNFCYVLAVLQKDGLPDNFHLLLRAQSEILTEVVEEASIAFEALVAAFFQTLESHRSPGERVLDFTSPSVDSVSVGDLRAKIINENMKVGVSLDVIAQTLNMRKITVERVAAQLRKPQSAPSAQAVNS